MRSIRRAFLIVVSITMLAGPASGLGVSAFAEESGPPAAKAPAPRQEMAPKPEEPITPDQMKGVSFEGLTEAQKGLAFSILSDQRCDCSCGMTLAGCRVKDSTCTRSLGLATQVLDLVKQGKGRDEIVKAVLTPPSKYVQFELPVGESPSAGPTDAKVTILYYLDYQ
jgi:hypothetical protein